MVQLKRDLVSLFSDFLSNTYWRIGIALHAKFLSDGEAENH